MKRFFCVECKKVKRVRKLPTKVTNPTTNIPQNRISVCNSHLLAGKKVGK